MLRGMMFLGLVVFLLLPVRGAEAQPAGSAYRNLVRPRSPRLDMLAPPRASRLGTYTSNRYQGFRTRADRLRMLSPLTRRRHGLLADPIRSRSPIRNSLDQHNLLRSRSMLGSRAAAGIGRYDYLPDESGRPRGDIGRWRASPVLPQTVSKAAEFIAFEVDPAVRLAKKADECFELGIAYFRNRDLIKARNYFERVRDLQRDRPRAFIADVFVAYDKGDYNRALLSLLRALERAETLEDLKLDRFIERLYKGDDYEEKQRAFKRTVESVNLFVNSRANAPLMKVLLAYYAWLNGDLNTAIAAAEVAAGGAGDQPAPQIEKFRKLLIEAKDGAAVPPPGT